jgi:hypothetical protein
VTPRIRAGLLVAVVLAVCGLMLWGAFWYRSRAITPAAMLKRMPADDAVVVFIDFNQLRRSHIDQLLDNMTVGQDPEYQSFIKKIDFDYRHDLDTAMLTVAPSGKFMLLKGRFDWKALTSYALSVDGRCNNSVCRLVGSTPDRRISFFPLQPNLMALAVSQDESAAEQMQVVRQRPEPELPDAPIWLMIPPGIVNSPQSLPPGTQVFARSLEHAQSVMLWMTADGGAFAAKLSVRCANVQDAVEVASQLTKVTSLLRRMIESENKTPNPADLSGFLTAGSFHNEGTKVVGSWPIQRVLIENLLGGK